MVDDSTCFPGLPVPERQAVEYLTVTSSCTGATPTTEPPHSPSTRLTASPFSPDEHHGQLATASRLPGQEVKNKLPAPASIRAHTPHASETHRLTITMSTP